VKRQLTLILAVTFALVLIGSLAYATEQTKPTKPVDLRPAMMSEEQKLETELLEAVENTQKKLPGTSVAKKTGTEVKARVLAKRPEK
jgi:hypothetical protein